MWLVVCVVALLGVLMATDLTSYVLILLQPLDNSSICPVYEALAPPKFHENNSTVLEILHGAEYRKWSIGNLAGAVRVDTQVHDQMPDVEDSPQSWAAFADFHRYLEKAFPLVHANTKIHKINTYGLVLHWRGSDPSLKPLMLAAHQDVVPVQKDTLQEWSYPPFEGHYDGKYVYGRGASDCKNSLIAVLEAVELLMREDYKPARGVVMAFGFDEEISGVYGAKRISQFLEEKFGANGIYALIDEGPGLIQDPLSGQLVAAPSTGEKGYLDLKVELSMHGGHSSVPPDHSSIGIMGELASNIEADPYVPKLTPENPILQYLQCIAVNSGDRVSKLKRKAIIRAAFDRVANLKLVLVLGKHRLSKYLIQTSQAVDLFRGGEKANALPEYAQLVVNHRISVGESVDFVKNRFASRVKSIAEKYDIDMIAYGENVYKASNSHGHFNVEMFSEHSLEYAPVSPSNDTVWEYLARTTRHVFEHLVLNNSTDYPMVTAPSIMPANTDTKYYWNLTKHIFRYSPMIVDYMEINIHSVDEKIEFDGHLQLTAFYYEYIQNVDTPAADNK